MIPAELAWLFWEIDPEAIDLVRDRDYIIERVMQRGDWRAMRWLIGSVEKAALADYLVRRGDRLTPRDRAFWSLIAEVPFHAPPGGGRPAWTG